MSKLGQKVIYQLYPKSFYDSNNDGIGDLRGIIEKIDYLKKLHVDLIWFNPFFKSPLNDNGYDISNYKEIDPRFGTMADFDEMVAKLGEAGIGIMLDMVLNHCSTDHEWFQKALAGDPYYQNFFYLRAPKPDGSLPSTWHSKFGGSAWAKFGNTGKYYLHLYDSSQAELNWHNPDVRHHLQDVVRFWQKKGVKGLRFDVLNVIGKDGKFEDAPNIEAEKALYTDTPIVHQFIRELNQTTFGKDPEIVTVGEMSSTSIQNSIAYTRPANHELDMVFSFHHLKVDYDHGEKWSRVPFDFNKLKHLLFEWQAKMDQGGGWQALFWNNHDQPWALNRFGDPVNYRVESAKMLATTIHLMRGTPYIYMGEELGMIDPAYHSMEDYVDVEAKNAYHQLIEEGHSKQAAFEIVHSKARDNSRTPMHWDDSQYAGFSNTKPWLMPTDQDQINVKDELAHGSIFNYYQQLIKLRRSEPLISDGHFAPLLEANSQVLAYERYLDGQKERLLVLNNFFSQPVKVSLPTTWQGKPVTKLIGNYQKEVDQLGTQLALRPYESIVVKG